MNRYIIVYEPYHDYCLFGQGVYLSLDDAILAIQSKTHSYYDYEDIAVMEIGDVVNFVAHFDVTKKDGIVRNDDRLWEGNLLRDIDGAR